MLTKGQAAVDAWIHSTIHSYLDDIDRFKKSILQREKDIEKLAKIACSHANIETCECYEFRFYKCKDCGCLGYSNCTRIPT